VYDFRSVVSTARQDNNIGEYWLAISQEDFTVETA